jgi:hypothetical protein
MSFSRIDGVVRSGPGEAIDGCDVYVCTQPNSIDPSNPSIPPSPLATIYSDVNGVDPITQPLQTDGNGNYFFYATPDVYTVVFFDPLGRIPSQAFPDQTVATPGGGSVSSVGLTMPAEFSVANSPVTGSDTFEVTKVSQVAGSVWAGPASGPSAPPTFKSLAVLAAAIGLGAGTVTSVDVTVETDGNLVADVSGGPVVDAGTIDIQLSLANQAANKFPAGPASGGSGPTSSRFLVPADLPGLLNVPFAAAPVFDASASSVFAMTLTGNVSSSSVTNPTTGQRITFILTQDGTGSRTFAWPANFGGASQITGEPNNLSVQSFVYNGSRWCADGPGICFA